MDSLKPLVKEAIVLKSVEHIHLSESILYSSSNKPNLNIEQNWIVESEARYEAYKNGELAVIDWDNIKKRYEN